MKTKKEIKVMILRCNRLRKAIPHHSIFGDDNWKGLDDNIEALTKCLTMDEEEIQDAETTRLDALDELGQDWDEDGKIGTYDWVLEKAEDDLVTDEDLEVFEKKGE